jgi:cell division protein FtsQ
VADDGKTDVRAAPGRGGGAGGGDGDDRPVATVVAVDPRMRSRRIGVRRDAGRRRLKRLTLALSVAALVVGLAVATRTPLLDVDRVTVTGTERTSVEDVVRLAAVERGEPLVSVDPGAVANRIEELPWVDSARVERAWPSTVKIQVTERVAVAVVQVTDERAAVVDAEGWVVSIESRSADAPADPAGPLVLTGIDERVAEGEQLSEEARAALAVASALAERMPGAVSGVSTDLDAELVDGGFIRFGSVEDLDDKVTAARTVLDDVDITCLELLDVRVPGSPALTRNQRCP